MTISAVDSRGNVCNVNVAADNLMLVGWLYSGAVFFAVLTRRSATGPLALMAYGSFALGLTLCVAAVLAAALFQQWYMRRHQYCQMSASAESTIGPILTELRSKLKLAAKCCRVVWSPTTFSVSARVFGSVPWRPVIALTGGFVVLAERDPHTARAVLAHELAHVANKDHVAHPLAAFLILSITLEVVVSAWALSVLAGESLMVAVLIVLLFVPFRLCILVPIAGSVLAAMVYRRELIADAVAATTIGDPLVYLRLLARTAPGESRRRKKRESQFHPSTRKRVEALTAANPVLATTFSLAFLALMPIFASLVQLLVGFFEYPRVFGVVTAGDILAATSASSVVPLLARIIHERPPKARERLESRSYDRRVYPIVVVWLGDSGELAA